MPKQVKKKTSNAKSSNGRVRKLTKKQAKLKAKKDLGKRKPLPDSFKLTVRVVSILKQNWQILGGIVLVYLLLNIVFASGLSNIGAAFSTIKTDLNTNGSSGIFHAAGGFANLVSTSGASGSSTASILQTVLFVLESLVIIWALRHLLSGQKIGVKQAYYKAMTPLIPFLLVILMIIIQLLPVTIGAKVFSTIASSAFVGGTIASVISGAAFIILAGWSLYMVSASIFALYIVTLPDMHPRQALRSAKDLVRFRRLLVVRKVLFLPVLILLAMGVIIMPLILFVQAIVPSVFFILAMVAILFIHTYFYSLYRSLLD